MAAEWRGVLAWSWNSERPLVFSHVVLTKTLGVRRAQKIRVRITRHMDLWDRDQHAGLVGDAKVEGAAREGKATSRGEEKDDAVAWSFHKTVLLGSSGRPSVGQPTGRGEGVSSQMTNALKPGDRLQRSSGRITRTCMSPRLKPHVRSLRGVRGYTQNGTPRLHGG